MRNRDGTWTIGWALARDMEALEGRERAEVTWGTGYYRDELGAESIAPPELTARVLALERDRNTLFALSAMRSAEVAELAARRTHKSRY